MFLLNGMLFSSMHAEASFFSNLLSADASADTNLPGNPQNDLNSQNMTLLQANVSTNSVVEEKATPNQISEDVSINIVSDNALLAMTGPSGVSDGTEVEDYSGDLEIYVIRKGDTFSQIADMFGVTVDTILSVNDLEKGSSLKEGEVLLILPFSGVEHTVTKGQTLQGIAKSYSVSIYEIKSANELGEDAKIAIGQKLIIPGAEMKTATSTASKPTKTYVSQAPLKDTTGYFTYPTVSWARRTRGIQKSPKHKGVDLAAPVGTPIYAAAAGRVIKAFPTGYNGGFGKMVVIQHSNGTSTLYAHMSAVKVSTGQKVSQGQTIGLMGNTGHSFGSHLHIEVLGGKNPF